MRPLSEDEATLVFQKLSVYIGDKVMDLVKGNEEESHYFRLHKERVYYLNEELLKYSGCINNKNLVSVGICLGKFTKKKKFHLHITSLNHIVHYGMNKVWLKSNSQSFIYGNNVLKKHVEKMTEDMPQNTGVAVMCNNIPLGFGILAKSYTSLTNSLPDDIAVLHQADIGEYLRHEAELI